VSKRSFRRLAVVAGAALAVGSMAPAMASRIDVDSDADTSADVTLPISLEALTGLVNVGNISALNDLAIGDVSAIVDVLGINVGDITADVLANANVGDITASVLDAGTVNVANVLNASTVNVGNVTAMVGGVSANVANVAAIANVGDISATVGDVLSGNNVLGGNLLGGGLLGLPLGSLLDIDANANVLASVLAIL